MVEQIIGRGLRRRFPYKNREGEYEVDEKLWIIEHPNFKRFWEAERQRHGYDFHINSGAAEVNPVTVRVEEDKIADYDIEVPILAGGAYKTRSIDTTAIDVDAMPARQHHIADFSVDNVQRVHKSLGEQLVVTDEEHVDLRFYTFYNLVKAKIVNLIVEKNRLVGSGVKAELDRKIDRYIEEKLFVDFEPDNREHVKRLNLEPVVDEILGAFEGQISQLSYVEREFKPSVKSVKVSDTRPKQTTKIVYESPLRSVFNLADCDSNLEREFMSRLDEWKGVEAWSHVVPFKIPYYDEEYGFHYYIPDFIVRAGGVTYLVETKGEGFAKQKDVASKRDVAERWIEKASEVTDSPWQYLFVLDSAFGQYRALESFDAFVRAVSSNEPRLL
jgi:hypothetical protein